jgi:hypothetical protein
MARVTAEVATRIQQQHFNGFRFFMFGAIPFA